ncbi:MAG: winged helix-turn-helix transcriptional regulator [Verrucomicrobiota bacterium]
MAENPSPEPMPADDPQTRPPFNEVSVLFPLLTFYTVAYLGLMAAEFVLRGAFIMPAGLMPIYIALTGAYAADKEIRRWAGTPEPPRKGSVFVYLWLLFYLVAFMIRAFRPEFALPEELGRVALQVLGIFFGSRASKYIWEARGRTVVEAELPERGERVLELIRAKGRITNREVADALQVSPASAKRILADLSARGQIQAKGVGRGTFYTHSDDPRMTHI